MLKGVPEWRVEEIPIAPSPVLRTDVAIPRANATAPASPEGGAKLVPAMDASRPVDVKRPASMARRTKLPVVALDGEIGAIRVEGGELPRVIDEAEEALLKATPDVIFQRDGRLVHVARIPLDVAGAGASGRRGRGLLEIRAVTVPLLVDRLTKAAVFLGVDARHAEGVKRIDCPERVAKTYLERVGRWRVPTLVGVVHAPTLRRDGSILAKCGYDPASGLYADFDETAFPPIPETPSLDDAMSAAKRLGDLLDTFAWREPHDRSAMIAALLTALVRKSLRTAPLFLIRAPVMGSGKTLLASLVGLLATGQEPVMMQIGANPEEGQKRWLATLASGVPVVCLDNLERPLDGDYLCTILTEPNWTSRILGKSENVTVATAVTIVATGNNASVVGDLQTRAIPIDLDPRCERPEERTFDVNLRQYVTEHRGDLVRCALTVLRAYHLAGRPDRPRPEFGRFEEWSAWVRGSVIWSLGHDPCRGRDRLRTVDPVEGLLRSVLHAVHVETRGERTTAAELIETAKRDPSGELYRVLVGIAAERGGDLSVIRLGRWLSSVENRIGGGLRVESPCSEHGTRLWQTRVVTDETRDLGDAGPTVSI